jgi:hypothetical protein
MTPEERSLLERTYQLAEENNQILTSMRRRGRLGLIFRICYWVIIIGISIGAFYFIQPYVDFLRGLGGSPDSQTSYGQQIQDLLN